MLPIGLVYVGVEWGVTHIVYVYYVTRSKMYYILVYYIGIVYEMNTGIVYVLNTGILYVLNTDILKATQLENNVQQAQLVDVTMLYLRYDNRRNR